MVLHTKTGDNFKWEHCPKTFNHLAIMKDHKKIHVCRFCLTGKTPKLGLVNHTRWEHENMKFLCDYCGLKFNYRQRLKNHKKTVHNGRRIRVPKQQVSSQHDKFRLTNNEVLHCPRCACRVPLPHSVRGHMDAKHDGK